MCMQTNDHWTICCRSKWIGEQFTTFLKSNWTEMNAILCCFSLYSMYRRGQGFVPAVRKQGSCGACWAYSVVSNIESALAINNQTKVTLSTQQMVDCAQNGNKGCGGGDTCLLLEWLKNDSIKIETESQYPMTEDKNSICSANDNLTEFYNIVDFSCDR